MKNEKRGGVGYLLFFLFVPLMDLENQPLTLVALPDFDDAANHRQRLALPVLALTVECVVLLVLAGDAWMPLFLYVHAFVFSIFLVRYALRRITLEDTLRVYAIETVVAMLFVELIGGFSFERLLDFATPLVLISFRALRAGVGEEFCKLWMCERYRHRFGSKSDAVVACTVTFGLAMELFEGAVYVWMAAPADRGWAVLGRSLTIGFHPLTCAYLSSSATHWTLGESPGWRRRCRALAAPVCLHVMWDFWSFSVASEERMAAMVGIVGIILSLCVMMVTWPAIEDNPSTAPSISRLDLTEDGWHDRLTDCLDDQDVCCSTLWCPELRWSHTMDRAGLWRLRTALIVSFTLAIGIVAGGIILYVRPGTIWAAYMVLLLYAMRIALFCDGRTQLRVMKNIPGHACTDCLAHSCCMRCAVAQEARHVQASL
jgi:Cys-rich protein (TIGR01571 family)